MAPHKKWHTWYLVRIQEQYVYEYYYIVQQTTSFLFFYASRRKTPPLPPSRSGGVVPVPSHAAVTDGDVLWFNSCAS